MPSGRATDDDGARARPRALRILHAIHDFLPRHRAGSEIYAFHLASELARTHVVTVLCAEYDPSRGHGSITRQSHGGLPVVELVNNWAFSRFEETYSSSLLNDALGRILDEERPDVLHLHSLLNLTLDLPALAAARGIPVVATLHDHTLVCPSGGQRVHMAEQHVCRSIDTRRCSRCFPQSAFHAQMSCHGAASTVGRSPALLGLAGTLRRRAPRLFAALQGAMSSAPVALTAADIEARLEAVRRAWRHVDLFVSPSEALAAEFRALGMPADRLVVSDYGFVPLPPRPRTASPVLRIGFVGTLTWHKGAHVLLEAVSRMRPGGFEVIVHGDPDVFPAYAGELRAAAAGLPVQFAGGFDESRIADVYAGIDVLVVPSLWPENSPLVIHEAWMAGVPVVGSDQGGIPGLVTQERDGLLYDAWSPAQLAEALQRLVDEPGLRERLAASLPRVKGIDEDAGEWAAVYRRVASAGRVSLRPVAAGRERA